MENQTQTAMLLDICSVKSEDMSQDDTQTEDDLTNELEQDVHKDKDLLKPQQREKRTISPLNLFREDFSQFKEDMLRIFKDKKTEHEDNKASSSTLSLLREDLNQFKEDMTNIFSNSLSKERDVKSGDQTNHRSLFTEDLPNIFRIGLSKERDLATKEETSKIKVLEAARTDENLLRGDQTVQDSEGVKENSDQMDDGLKGKLKAEESINKEEDKENLDEEKSDTSVSETQPSEEMMSQTGDNEEEKKEEEEKSLPLKTLLSGISLLSLKDAKKDSRAEMEGDMWSVKNFACYLTFDPNTANSELLLTDNNRSATRVWSDHHSSDHPERFERCPQVLCREGLLDSAYWEVEWSGGADIGVTYNNISRDGDVASCLLGHNKQSWSLECSERCYTPCYNTRRFKSSSPEPFSHRVGVHLNWSAGSLSFYCVSQDAMTHIHTFNSTFTEPLYPGFWVWAYNGSVSLCQVELDWERLLQ